MLALRNENSPLSTTHSKMCSNTRTVPSTHAIIHKLQLMLFSRMTPQSHAIIPHFGAYVSWGNRTIIHCSSNYACIQCISSLLRRKGRKQGLRRIGLLNADSIDCELCRSSCCIRALKGRQHHHKQTLLARLQSERCREDDRSSSLKASRDERMWQRSCMYACMGAKIPSKFVKSPAMRTRCPKRPTPFTNFSWKLRHLVCE